MKQTELHLSETDRLALDAFRSKGVHPAREVNRAHVLMALDGGVADATTCQVLGLGRTALWRTRANTWQVVAQCWVWAAQRCGGPAPHTVKAAWNTRCTMKPGRGSHVNMFFAVSSG